MRTIKSEGGGSAFDLMSMFSGAQNNLSPIVIPAEDIAIGAKQAPAITDSAEQEEQEDSAETPKESAE